MGIYRLEIWFNSPQGTIDWGIAQATGGGATPFQNGGTRLAKNNDVVSINGAGNSSTFDIYVFDVSGDGVARQLDSIEIDYERATGGSGDPRNPISWGDNLRNGMTGAQFSGTADGYTTGIGQEETVFSAPAPMTAQRRWSLASGYQGVTPGHYTFDATITVSGQEFSFDPEMDVNT